MAITKELIGWITVWLFRMGFKGKPCWLCSFHKASHIKPELEFDMENYPCDNFTQMKEGS